MNEDVELIERVLNAAREVAEMQYPSVQDLLAKRGFGYEASKVQALVDAVKAAREVA